jgi:hypothetical protein
MLRRLTVLSLGMSLSLALGAGRALAQEDELFPDTKDLGRAAVEYEDDEIQVVAAYYYSQFNHDSPWLLVEMAVSSENRMTIHRDAFRLITPDGVEIALAPQTRFSQDMPRIRELLQNAAPMRHAVGSYFNRRNRSEGSRFFSLPGGSVVHDDFVVDRFRVVLGDLFFEAPTGLWEDGTYTLVVEHEDVRAAVPIELQ